MFHGKYRTRCGEIIEVIWSSDELASISQEAQVCFSCMGNAVALLNGRILREGFGGYDPRYDLMELIRPGEGK